MTTTIDWQITIAPWMENPSIRWQAGLTMGGIAWQNGLQEYPAKAVGTYTRTGELGNTAAYNINGLQCDLIAKGYARFLLWGTGIYGPRGAPITPVNGKFLSWVSTGNISPGTRIFARAVAGTIWPGKLQEIIDKIQQAVVDGIIQWSG